MFFINIEKIDYCFFDIYTITRHKTTLELKGNDYFFHYILEYNGLCCVKYCYNGIKLSCDEHTRISYEINTTSVKHFYVFLLLCSIFRFFPLPDCFDLDDDDLDLDERGD
jgi:hypothetical protein